MQKFTTEQLSVYLGSTQELQDLAVSLARSFVQPAFSFAEQTVRAAVCTRTKRARPAATHHFHKLSRSNLPRTCCVTHSGHLINRLFFVGDQSSQSLREPYSRWHRLCTACPCLRCDFDSSRPASLQVPQLPTSSIQALGLKPSQSRDQQLLSNSCAHHFGLFNHLHESMIQPPNAVFV